MKFSPQQILPTLAIVFSLLGVIFSLISIWYLWNKRNRRRMVEELLFLNRVIDQITDEIADLGIIGDEDASRNAEYRYVSLLERRKVLQKKLGIHLTRLH